MQLDGEYLRPSPNVFAQLPFGPTKTGSRNHIDCPATQTFCSSSDFSFWVQRREESCAWQTFAFSSLLWLDSSKHPQLFECLIADLILSLSLSCQRRITSSKVKQGLIMLSNQPCF
jgi:hypothetical protein